MTYKELEFPTFDPHHADGSSKSSEELSGEINQYVNDQTVGWTWIKRARFFNRLLGPLAAQGITPKDRSAS